MKFSKSQLIQLIREEAIKVSREDFISYAKVINILKVLESEVRQNPTDLALEAISELKEIFELLSNKSQELEQREV